jgi:hypothetical protein
MRSISVPDCDCTANELAQAISEYINLLDKQMKDYLCAKADARSIEIAYYNYLNSADIHI